MPSYKDIVERDNGTDLQDTMESHPHGTRFVDDDGRCLACALSVAERGRDEAAAEIKRLRAELADTAEIGHRAIARAERAVAKAGGGVVVSMSACRTLAFMQNPNEIAAWLRSIGARVEGE